MNKGEAIKEVKEIRELEDKYEKANSKRQKYFDAILNSKSRNRIVVAGPGTGKTFLFKEILARKNKSLTLTFVNALVEDLSVELYGLSEVRTLHSYARNLLSGEKKDINVFPRLSEIISDDAKILLKQEIDFDYLFHNRNDDVEFIEFYSKRRKYYGFFGYTDIIFAVVKYLEKNREKIPTYDQVVVDEFQDFNKLEVSLIDLLAEKSPVLLAGDDDQALYAFKSASTDHIRRRHGGDEWEFEPFYLPFCSRSTRVIVEAANDIIESAKKEGFLKDRIEKPYVYFEDKERDLENGKYQKLVYTQLWVDQIAWFIEKQIKEIAKELRGKFSVLVISPYKKQSKKLKEALIDKGFSNIKSIDQKGEELSLLEGLKILIKDDKSKLGWRIICKFLLNEADFDSLLRETHKKEAKNIYDILDSNFKKEVGEIIKLLRRIVSNNEINEEDATRVLKRIGLEPHIITLDVLKNKIMSVPQQFTDAGIRRVPITATTVQGSKGLEADFVFITHFDDRFFLDNKGKEISTQNICNFLVSLTRARKRVYLISSEQREPIFLKWIRKDLIEGIK